MSTVKLAASLLVVLTVALGAVAVWAETVNCTPITSLPAVITVQGIYCFTGNLDTAMTSGDAIAIIANNVVLDLNGFKLGGLAAGSGTNANGIAANNRKNITIKNGTVRGFFRGINLNNDGSQGHVVEDVRAEYCAGDLCTGRRPHHPQQSGRRDRRIDSQSQCVCHRDRRCYGYWNAGAQQRRDRQRRHRDGDGSGHRLRFMHWVLSGE